VKLKRLLLGTALVTASSCAASGPPAKDVAAMPPPQAQTALDKQIAALSPAKAVQQDKLGTINKAITDYFARTPTQRAYVMTD
jgi:hypothetical protein